MMILKKAITILATLSHLFSFFSACALALDDTWGEMPVITHVYEVAKEKIFLEWEGSSNLYQINVDGKNVDTVNINTGTISIKPGVHQISIIPVNYESKNVDTAVELNIGAIFGGSIDLGALGTNPKNLLQGTPSKPLKFNYSVDPFINASPEINSAITDFDGNVVLTFQDKYDAHSYRLTIKSGKDINYAFFDTTSEESAGLLSKNNTTVTLL